jgi:negative regulator of sigma E activity
VEQQLSDVSEERNELSRKLETINDKYNAITQLLDKQKTDFLNSNNNFALVKKELDNERYLYNQQMQENTSLLMKIETLKRDHELELDNINESLGTLNNEKKSLMAANTDLKEKIKDVNVCTI